MDTKRPGAHYEGKRAAQTQQDSWLNRPHELRRLDRTVVYEGKVLNFCKDTMQLPDGKIEKWDYVQHKKGGGSCIIPVLPDGRILMIHQYRPAIDRWTIELPAGARDAAGEDPAQTAARELEEETGYRAGSMQKLLTIKTAVAWCNEETEIFLAQDLARVGGQHLDEAEVIKVEPVDLPELQRRIFAGEIQDAKTCAGILAYSTWKLTR